MSLLAQPGPSRGEGPWQALVLAQEQVVGGELAAVPREWAQEEGLALVQAGAEVERQEGGWIADPSRHGEQGGQANAHKSL